MYGCKKMKVLKKQKAIYVRTRPLSAGRLEDSALRDPQAFSLTKRVSPKASQRVREIYVYVCVYNEISYICR